MTMRLYECDVDSVTYWIAAESVFGATVVLRKTLLDMNGNIETDLHSISVDEVGERRAQKVNFRDDEENTTRTMWEEFQRDTKTPRLLACSEH